jgi:BlaI family transcriptional regulator, penicillinase repressor
MQGTLTKPEWAVMTALWEKSPQTLSGVIETMKGRLSWSYRTYASYLRKLCEKGFVGYEVRGRDNYYYPMVERESCILQESRELLQKVSEKSTKELLVCLIRESGLSSLEQAELARLLDELAGKGERI